VAHLLAVIKARKYKVMLNKRDNSDNKLRMGSGKRLEMS
jgi:hypothetical protein